MWRNPIFDEFNRMRGMMDEFFGSGNLLIGNEDNRHVRNPLMDVHETKKEIIAEVELPGVDKKDIQIHMTETGIEIKVERKHESEVEDKEKGYYHMERSYSGFYRHIPLPENADGNKTEAEYHDGILTLHIPKRKLISNERKQIEVK